MNRGVSFVVTVYNKALFLPAVLQAVENERVSVGGEIILVDDGSTDHSLALLRAFVEGKEQVKIIAQKNKGVAAATNAGVGAASCPFLRLVDGDDLLIGGSTAALREALERHDIAFAYGRYGLCDPLDAASVFKAIEGVEASRGEERVIRNPLRRVLAAQPFGPSATLIRRDCAEKVFPLPEKYKTSQDFVLGLRLAGQTPFLEMDAVFALDHRLQEGRLSSSKARMFADAACIVADEMDRADWPSAERRYALRRAAGRALHYTRRHLPCDLRQRLGLLWLKALSYVPCLRPKAEAMRAIALVYAEALADPARNP